MRENHQKHRRRLRRRPNGAAAFGGRPIGSVFLISLYHISALQTQVWLNPGFGLHFPARGTAPKHGFPKPGFGQTWVSGVLNTSCCRMYAQHQDSLYSGGQFSSIAPAQTVVLDTLYHGHALQGSRGLHRATGIPKKPQESLGKPIFTYFWGFLGKFN